MKTMGKITAAGLLALSALGLGATVASADNHSGASNDAAEAQALISATVTLDQAIAAAEQASGGKVAGIEFDNGDDGKTPAWDVEVLMADGTFKELVVNAQDGTVAEDAETDDDGGMGQDGEEDEDGGGEG